MPLLDDDVREDDDLVPHGALSLVHLRVADADRAMEFVRAWLGWETERYVAEHVSHYTLNTAVTVRLIGDPTAVPVRPNYVVSDVEVAVAAIAAAGGLVTDAEVGADGRGWAYAEDRQGVPLVVYTRGGGQHATSDAPPAGDVGFAFVTEDADEAAGFYGPVLGWDLRAAYPGSRYYDTVEHVGVFDENAVFGTTRPAAVTLYLEVPRLRAAVARLVELGGTAAPLPDERSMGPYFSVVCTDDQGTQFGVVATELD